MHEKELIQSLEETLAVSLPEKISWEALQRVIQQKVDALIQQDFQRLVYILYRIDVSERKLKEMLKEDGGKDAAGIISRLIIERQLKKIKDRNTFSTGNDDISEDEKW